MPEVIGPTVPRWRLGDELQRLRNAKALSTIDVGKHLDCSDSKIRKIEAGAHGVSRAELLVMMDLYDVPDDDRSPLLELQSLGRQRGWWVAYGAVPNRFAEFLSFEGSASRIRIFEPLMVHGLLQTPDYARAIAETVTGNVPGEEVERQVRIRLERQERVAQSRPDLWVILDEAAIRRVVGSPETMAGQLHHLLEVGREWSLQVVPSDHGCYPGFLGALTLFDFPDDLHSTVGYVESQAGNIYVEEAGEVTRCSLMYEHMQAAALSPPASARRIREALREIEGS